MLTEVSALGFDSYNILSEGGQSWRWVWIFFKWIPFCRHYTHSGSETTCARHHFNLHDRLRGRLTLAKEALNKYILLHSASCWVRACCCSEVQVFIFSEPLGSKAHDPGHVAVFIHGQNAPHALHMLPGGNFTFWLLLPPLPKKKVSAPSAATGTRTSTKLETQSNPVRSAQSEHVKHADACCH